MGFVGVIVALLFFVLHSVGAVRLWRHMPYSGELMAIALVISLILGLSSLLGILFNKRWGWPLALVLFSIGLGGTVLVYTVLGSSITLVLLFAVTVLAMLVSFIAVDLWEPDWGAQGDEPSWDAPMMDAQEAEVTDVKATVGTSSKKSSQKKASKKKSSRKKATRKKSTKKKSSRKKSRK